MTSPYLKDFSLNEHEIYVNCAAQGPFPKRTSRIVEQGIRDKENPKSLDMEYVTSRQMRTRKALGALINAPPDQIALANSTTWGENMLAQGLPWKSGDEVLMMEDQFPATSLPWETLTEFGVKIVRFPQKKSLFDLDAFRSHLSPRTRVVSLEWVHYVSGDRLPLDGILDTLKGRDIVSVLDVTQGLGAIPFDWQRHPFDALCCSGYKWLLSPYGSGFFAVKPGLGSRLRTAYANWLALDTVANGDLGSYHSPFVQTAQRFDVSSSMGYLNLDGMAESVSYILDVGPRASFEYTTRIIQTFQGHLDPKKWRAVNTGTSERQSCIVTLEMPDSRDADVFSAEAEKEGFLFCSRAKGCIRISPYLYNSSEQMKTLAGYLNAKAAKR